jgi:hypothetical protein
MLFICLLLRLGVLFELLEVLLAEPPVLQFLLVDFWLQEHLALAVLEALHLGKLRVLVLEFLPLPIGDLDRVDDDLAVVEVRERADIVRCLPFEPLLDAPEDSYVVF